jgi:hypothetical protein
MDKDTRHPAGSTVQNASPEPAKNPVAGMEKIRRLKAMANRGLFAMALFIAMSICAIRDFDFLHSFSEHFRTLLGHPPSAKMISAALLLYSFAAIVLILSRMTTGAAKFGAFVNVGYLAGFYFFYHFAGNLEENFWAVFATGITVLSLESYHIRTYCNEEIRKELETITGIQKDRHDDV